MHNSNTHLSCCPLPTQANGPLTSLLKLMAAPRFTHAQGVDSVVITRRRDIISSAGDTGEDSDAARGPTETHVPTRLLHGLLPITLLSRYEFWQEQGGSGVIRGYARPGTAGRLARGRVLELQFVPTTRSGHALPQAVAAAKASTGAKDAPPMAKVWLDDGAGVAAGSGSGSKEFAVDERGGVTGDWRAIVRERAATEQELGFWDGEEEEEEEEGEGSEGVSEEGGKEALSSKKPSMVTPMQTRTLLNALEAPPNTLLYRLTDWAARVDTLGCTEVWTNAVPCVLPAGQGEASGVGAGAGAGAGAAASDGSVGRNDESDIAIVALSRLRVSFVPRATSSAGKYCTVWILVVCWHIVADSDSHLCPCCERVARRQQQHKTVLLGPWRAVCQRW